MVVMATTINFLHRFTTSVHQNYIKFVINQHNINYMSKYLCYYHFSEPNEKLHQIPYISEFSIYIQLNLDYPYLTLR